MRKLVRFSSILLLAAVLFSCKQNTSYEEPDSQGISDQQTEKQADNADDYVTVKLSVNKSAREAFVPDAESGKEKYFFDLTGYFNGSKNLEHIYHWDNFDAITGSEFQIKRGSWELILTASAGDYNDYTEVYTVYPVLRGTFSKNISKAETIPFKLEKLPDSEAPGEYYMYLHYPKSENWVISASVKELTTLNGLEDEYYNPILKKESDDFVEIHGKLPAGEYKLGVKFVYKTGSLEMTSVVPIFMVIAPGCQTHGDIFLDTNKLNIAHPINYVDYDAHKGNYSLPEGYPTVFTSYESYKLPIPTRTDSDNYEFVGWYTDSGFWKDSKIENTPLYTENGEFELTLYPKWRTLSSPYFSLEDKEGINVVLSESCKELFDKGTATSMQCFIRNEDTGLELNVWFGADEVIKMNYEWNYPFVNNGTSYEVRINIGDVGTTDTLAIISKTGIGEDEAIYDNADFDIDENGILHITNIPDYIDYSKDDDTYKEKYFMQIWMGADWDSNPEWGAQYDWDDWVSSIDIDLKPYLNKCQLYGKPFMTNSGRDYWYNGKKYGIGFGSPTFTYGDLNHEYTNTEEDDPKPVQDLIVLECDDSYDNYIAFATPISARSGYTTVNVEWSVEPSANATQVGFQLQNENDNCKCGSSFSYVFIEDFDDYKVSRAPCFAGSTYTAYDEDGSHEENCSDGATRIQFFFQNANDDYKPVSGKVYIKRVWLSGKGLDSKLILLNTNSNSGNSSVEEDGPFVLKCNNDYNNFIDLKVPIKEGSGYTTINAEIKWEADNGVKAGFELRDADYAQASSTVKFGTDYSVVSGKCLYGSYYDDWSTGEATPVACSDSAVRLQMFIEERTEDGYEATQGTIYIKRLWLSGEGKDDLLLVGSNNNNG